VRSWALPQREQISVCACAPCLYASAQGVSPAVFAALAKIPPTEGAAAGCPSALATSASR
jgi:hypothetical protein